MAGKKYKYNLKTLSYEQVELSARDRLLKLVTYAFTGVVFASIFITLTYFFIDSPKEKQLKRENQQLLLQYEILNGKMDQITEVISDLEYRDDNIYRVVFEAEPISENIRKAGFGGVNRYKYLEGYTNSELVINTTARLEQLTKQLYIQSKSFDEVIKLAKKKEEMLASIPSIMPISNNDLKRVGSGYGMRMHPVLKIPKFHDGMDFTAPTGTEIYVTGLGTVKKVSKKRYGYGYHIIVDHGFGYETLYAHMSEIKVRVGQKLQRGDVIGLVGNTGTSTAPHLHYEVRKNGAHINPVNYYYQDLSPKQFEEIIELSDQPLQSFD
ncbi:MAG: peptidase M23 [Crocinitomicaceae bacterium]|nr:peptidase M23 [Crocinitomicaceae bacterium]|tara:strand:+ start:2877 stop:3848 length:972 start_codon:yes stop_codon:yes gene_type:complete